MNHIFYMCDKIIPYICWDVSNTQGYDIYSSRDIHGFFNPQYLVQTKYSILKIFLEAFEWNYLNQFFWDITDLLFSLKDVLKHGSLSEGVSMFFEPPIYVFEINCL